MVDEDPQGPLAEDLGEQHLDPRLGISQPLLDLFLECCHWTS